jgi:CarboxypepD_reg-like domain
MVCIKRIRTVMLLLVLYFPGIVSGQLHKGKVFSSETKSGIAYVNIGIIGKNVGTVADQSGNFSIELDNIYSNDSIRFSMIGYESKSFLVSSFKENSINTIFLNPKSYYLTEVKVFYHRIKKIRIGTPVTSQALKSGFAENNLGSELGINVKVKGQVKLENINLNVATCTYDSVTYRLNIYQIVNDTEYKNILTKPIYISFSKDKIIKPITFDLRKYSITIEGNVLITLELYKDQGEGRLLFYTQYFTGYTYHKKTSEGKWTKASGLIGMYLHGELMNGGISGSEKISNTMK